MGSDAKSTRNLQIGDDARAAIRLASLSHTYVRDDRIDEADRTSQRALAIAVEAGSKEAWLRATSATASVAFARGDYETAYQSWAVCAAREPAEDSGEHQAYALDSLAQIGNWPRFRRELDRYARRLRRADAQFAFAENLYLPALTWLRRGNFAAAGTVLAYGVLLAFEAASKGYGAKGRELSTSDREQILVKTATSMGSTKAVFVLLELPDADREFARVTRERSGRPPATTLTC